MCIRDRFELARDLELEDGPALNNALVRDKLADFYVQQQGLKYTRYRTMTALSRGETPGPEASIAKLVSATKQQEVSNFAMDLQELTGGLMQADAEMMHGIFQGAYMSSPGYRIAGGTDEILRNIIAERVLGLPQDQRVDKGIPFNELPSGKAN